VKLPQLHGTGLRKVLCTGHFVRPLPEGHRFPMRKYSLLRQRLEQAGLPGGVAPPEARATSDAESLLAHYASNLRKVIDGNLTSTEVRHIGFPWPAQWAECSRCSAGATLEACRTKLNEGIGVSLAGRSDHGLWRARRRLLRVQ
jgi:acetoin utilization deacetylase AcuC-like enzyme